MLLPSSGRGEEISNKEQGGLKWPSAQDLEATWERELYTSPHKTDAEPSPAVPGLAEGNVHCSPPDVGLEGKAPICFIESFML